MARVDRYDMTSCLMGDEWGAVGICFIFAKCCGMIDMAALPIIVIVVIDLPIWRCQTSHDIAV